MYTLHIILLSFKYFYSAVTRFTTIKLLNHLKACHNIDINIYSKKFQDFNEFTDWKELPTVQKNVTDNTIKHKHTLSLSRLHSSE